VALLLGAPVAGAHEFVCEKTVDGQSVVHVDTYPTTVTYEWTITNLFPTGSSTADDVTDTLFPTLPFAVPLVVPVGGSVTETDTLTIGSYEECAELANVSPGGDIYLINTLTVSFEPDRTTSCSAKVVCHPPGNGGGEGCLTRTPGYWGTHPEVTAEFLPVESCGLDLTNTASATQGSITEDLCSVGNDHKVYGSPQEAQLVRQCAAAALNIEASHALGGSCEESLSSERFAECCAACGGGAADIAASGCIDDLDDFNNSADTLLEGGEEISLCHALELTCSANPTECQAAGGNGFVNERLETFLGASGLSSAIPDAVGCSGGPGGLFALLAVAGLLALRARRR
jgi:MYXO-CTERM domain-containing protein